MRTASGASGGGTPARGASPPVSKSWSPASAMLPQYEPPHRPARDDRTGVAADRVDRLRGSSGPHHAAAGAGGPQERMDGRPGVRGRERSLLAAPRAVVHAALDLLRVP